MNRFGDIDWSFQRLPPVYGFRVEKLVSLEKALEPLNVHIDQLVYFIEIAKKHCRYPNNDGLSKDQSASIYIYTMEWGETTLYRVLNQALRSENRQALKIWFPYLKLFDSALDLLPTVKEVVWRGVPLDIGKNFTKSQIFTWWAVSSCSSSVNIIETFLHNKTNSTLFLIEVVNGKKISGYTEYEIEDEVILKIGTEFRVKSHPLKRPDGSHIVHLIEVDNNSQQQQQQQLPTTEMKNLDINSNLKWKKYATTIAGGNMLGNNLNQLEHPKGIYIDYQHKSIYIADFGNHRIVKWKLGENKGQVVAGGNGPGNRIDQLTTPTTMIVDQKNKSLIICDYGNRRVVKWSLDNQQDKRILIENINCVGLVMNENGDLFVSDDKTDEVKRWKKGEKEGTIVAGGNGRGDQFYQLNNPTFIFIDRHDTIYISDWGNSRVMKWMKDSREGTVVAGGHGYGNSLEQLSRPNGLIVNEIGDVYVVDSNNCRIMCWPLASKQGLIIVGEKSDQLKVPIGLAFDHENNLYVVDHRNHRVQRFEIDQN